MTETNCIEAIRKIRVILDLVPCERDLVVNIHEESIFLVFFDAIANHETVDVNLAIKEYGNQYWEFVKKHPNFSQIKRTPGKFCSIRSFSFPIENE